MSETETGGPDDAAPLPSVPEIDEAVAASDAARTAAEAGTEESVALHNELLRADQYSEFILHAPREILSVLRQVAEHGDLVTVYFNEGKDFLLTSLLSADEHEVRLDKGSSSIMNQRALQAPRLFCITRHDKVKLQFILSGVREAEEKGRHFFTAAPPETLLRLQRREFYRLTTPITRPLICHVPIHHPDGRRETINVNIVDISAGGIAVLAPPQGIAFDNDMEFPGCSLDLPEIGVVAVTLRVRNNYEIVLRNGQRSRRSGCQFVSLLPTAQNLIQRYIIKIERERKARESGLA